MNYTMLLFGGNSNKPSSEQKGTGLQGGGGGSGKGISERRFVTAYTAFMQQVSPNMSADTANERARQAWDTLFSTPNLQLMDKKPSSGYASKAAPNSPVGIGLYRKNGSRFGNSGDSISYVGVMDPNLSALLSRKRRK